MNDIAHTQLLPFDSVWARKFKMEKEEIQKIFGRIAVSIEHIGSTSVDGLSSKPIIDIAVLIQKRKDADQFIDPLQVIGYQYDKEHSSDERYFFRKGVPTEFHLSIAYADQGDFWERQILFRDYLRRHPSMRDEYAAIKKELLKNNPIGKGDYLEGKSAFIRRIVSLAKEKRPR